ncbi:hypothetical protein AB0H29_11870 [Streptomyces thermolilacinus]
MGRGATSASPWAGAPGRVAARGSSGRVGVVPPRAAGPYAVDARTGNGTATTGAPRGPGCSRAVTVYSDNGDVTVRTAN